MIPHATRANGRRRGTLAAAVLATVIGVRQLVDLVLRATAPMWSPAAMMLVETLVVTGLYGALAWYFVVVPARLRSASAVAAQRRRLRPAVVHHQNGSVLRTVPGTPRRHLTLVRDAEANRS